MLQNACIVCEDRCQTCGLPTGFCFYFRLLETAEPRLKEGEAADFWETSSRSINIQKSRLFPIRHSFSGQVIVYARRCRGAQRADGRRGRPDGSVRIAACSTGGDDRRSVNSFEEDWRRLLEQNEPKRFDFRSGSIRAESTTGRARSENDVLYR